MDTDLSQIRPNWLGLSRGLEDFSSEDENSLILVFISKVIFTHEIYRFTRVHIRVSFALGTFMKCHRLESRNNRYNNRVAKYRRASLNHACYGRADNAPMVNGVLLVPVEEKLLSYPAR